MIVKIIKYNTRALYVLAFLLIPMAMVLSTPLQASAACPTPGTIYGTDIMTAGVPSTATYRLWVRIEPPNSSNNSVMLQVDGSTCFSPGGSASLPANTWSWVDYQNGSGSQVMQASLTAGNHSLELIGTEQNVGVDSILLLADPNCVPVNTGSNCTTAQVVQSGSTSTSTTSTGGSAATTTAGTAKANPLSSQNIISSGISLNSSSTPIDISQAVVITPTYVKGQTIKEVDYFLNSKKVYSAKKPPFTYKLNPNKLLSGKYILASKTIYTSGLSITAHETIVIKHPLLKNVSILIINNLWEILLAAIILAVAAIEITKNGVFILMMTRKVISRVMGKGNDGTGTDSTPQQTPPTIIRPTNPT